MESKITELNQITSISSDYYSLNMYATVKNGYIFEAKAKDIKGQFIWRLIPGLARNLSTGGNRIFVISLADDA